MHLSAVNICILFDFQVVVLNLPYSNFCFQIYTIDGNDTLVEVYNGRPDQGQTFMSSTNLMAVLFISDGTSTAKGFHARITKRN